MVEALRSGRDRTVTAVFAHNDLLAVGALAALQENGIGCPASVSVVGYNDSPLTGYLKPPLTTIRLQIDQMGRQAALGRWSRRSAGGTRGPRVTLAPDLIVRESTAPVRPG